MNGYKAFYKDRQTEVMANTSFEAQKKAAEFFKAKRPMKSLSSFAKSKVNKLFIPRTFEV